MTPNEYQQEALRTEHTPDIIYTDHDGGYTVERAKADHRLSRILHAMIGMATETGELQDAVKKHLIYGKPLDLVNVMEECGDTLWYIALALDASGFTFEHCMKRNIEKLRTRFPEKFTQAQALVRDLDNERTALEAQDPSEHDRLPDRLPADDKPAVTRPNTVKIISVDNYDHEGPGYDDKLIADNIVSEDLAKTMCMALNGTRANEDRYYKVVPSDYVLKEFQP